MQALREQLARAGHLAVLDGMAALTGRAEQLARPAAEYIRLDFQQL